MHKRTWTSTTPWSRHDDGVDVPVPAQKGVRLALLRPGKLLVCDGELLVRSVSMALCVYFNIRFKWAASMGHALSVTNKNEGGKACGVSAIGWWSKEGIGARQRRGQDGGLQALRNPQHRGVNIIYGLAAVLDVHHLQAGIDGCRPLSYGNMAGCSGLTCLVWWCHLNKPRTRPMKLLCAMRTCYGCCESVGNVMARCTIHAPIHTSHTLRLLI